MELRYTQRAVRQLAAAPPAVRKAFYKQAELLRRHLIFENLRKILLDTIRAHWLPSTSKGLRLVGSQCERDWSTACVWLFGITAFPDDIRSDGAIKALDRCIGRALRRCLGKDPASQDTVLELVEDFEEAMRYAALESKAARQYLEDVQKVRNVSTHQNPVDLSEALNLHRYAMGVLTEIGRLLQAKNIESKKS